jgi:hypothetical protein
VIRTQACFQVKPSHAKKVQIHQGTAGMQTSFQQMKLSRGVGDSGFWDAKTNFYSVRAFQVVL